MLNRKRLRYIDNKYDLTFCFDIRDEGRFIKTIITDNETECDVALIDLPSGAKSFYNEYIYEFSHKNIIEQVREILSKREKVAI